jgi:hypothetical protein
MLEGYFACRPDSVAESTQMDSSWTPEVKFLILSWL